MVGLVSLLLSNWDIFESKVCQYGIKCQGLFLERDRKRNRFKERKERRLGAKEREKLGRRRERSEGAGEEGEKRTKEGGERRMMTVTMMKYNVTKESRAYSPSPSSQSLWSPFPGLSEEPDI